MNAASVLKFLIKKQNLKISRKKILQIANLVGSDVILGMYSRNLVLKSNNSIYPLIWSYAFKAISLDSSIETIGFG